MVALKNLEIIGRSSLHLIFLFLGGCEWNWSPGYVGHSVFTEVVFVGKNDFKRYQLVSKLLHVGTCVCGQIEPSGLR